MGEEGPEGERGRAQGAREGAAPKATLEGRKEGTGKTETEREQENRNVKPKSRMEGDLSKGNEENTQKEWGEEERQGRHRFLLKLALGQRRTVLSVLSVPSLRHPGGP